MDLLHQPQKQAHNLLSFESSILSKKQLIFTCPLLLLFLLFSSIVLYNIVVVTPPLQQQKQHQYSLLDNGGFWSQILPKKQNHTDTGTSGTVDDKLRVCDYANGEWIWDESFDPRQWYTEECPFLDPGFRCRQNGRQNLDYLKWRWQPQECYLPRFNATKFLEKSRNKRIVFAGDSIGRNQWESLICMIAQGVSNKSTVYEENGNPITKHRGHLSVRFQDYNFTVEYYREPYLVTIARLPKNAPKDVRGIIRVDKLHWYSSKWVSADVLVFNTGHWWNEDKTIKMGFYFQEEEGINMTMKVKEAFQRSLVTWKSWVIQNLDPRKSLVFFRSYSPVHYREGTWKDGGHCDTNTSPETNYTRLDPEPQNNFFISKIIREIGSAKRKAYFLNITFMSEFRKDGHPSSHREPGTPAEAPQDCSHWCLPGVPDTWNELLYAHLLSKGFRNLII